MNRWLLLIVMALAPTLQAESVTFRARELFQIPFGKGREELGAKVQDGAFIIPRDFTMDAAGHFYIYDPNKHRIARYSSTGKFEIGYGYPETANQVFAHADTRENLWILVTEPKQGMFYGVYDPRGKRMNAGIFSRFNRFRLHVDDDFSLRVILASSKEPGAEQSYMFDEKNLLLKRKAAVPPPTTHHEVRQNGRVYFVDQVPETSKEDARQVNRITDESRRPLGQIKGTVIYVTDRGEIYTRVGPRELHIYDVRGALQSRVTLQGHRSSCSAIRFDAFGNIYLLDGIPDQPDQKDEDARYTSAMRGMRLIQWERQ